MWPRAVSTSAIASVADSRAVEHANRAADGGTVEHADGHAREQVIYL